MTINLNSNPYYDDFDANKQFYQILFKPGTSVQARELTQLQSILKNQISQFGHHIFKHGSVVIPGNTNADLTICHVKLVDTSYDVRTLEGKYVTGATTGLRGIIRKGIPKETIDEVDEPDTIYVSYTNSGPNGEKVFSANEVLTVEGITSTTFTTASGTPCGGAAIAFIDQGVYFVNGVFATVNKQSTIISKYSSAPSCRVLLQIVESVVTSDDDSTLLDPAQGSYNYAAQGADRLKIDLVLTALQLKTYIGEDYIELMRYNDGVLEEHSRYPKYNELDKGLARRSYETNGDYVTAGLTVSAREHLKTDLNGGRYDATKGGDASKMIYTVTKGKAYIKGFENEKISDTELVTDKSRTVDSIKATQVNLNPSFGQYFYVNGLKSLPSFKQHTAVSLKDMVGGVIIGSATLLAVDFVESNTTDNNAIYKMFVTDIAVNPSYAVDNIGVIVHGSTDIATVLHKVSVVATNSLPFIIDEEVEAETRCANVTKYVRQLGTMYINTRCVGQATPRIGDTIVGMSSGGVAKIIDKEVIGKNINNNLLVELPYDFMYSAKNEANTSDMSYVVYYEADVAITAGAGTMTVSGLTVNPKEQGNMLLVTTNGVQPLSTATVASDGLSVTFAGIFPASGTLKVFCAATVNVAAAGPKTKSLVVGTVSAPLSPLSNTIVLPHADLVRVTSIVSADTGELDVTDRYNVDNGQTDYVYGRGFITLKPGMAQPVGMLTVTYDYFAHNAGDYFSVDSYSSMSGYYDSPLLTYTSKNDRKTFDLRNVLDFRPRVGTDGTFGGPGAQVGNLVQNDSRIVSTIRHYVGRIDRIVFAKDNSLRVINGTPDDAPVAPMLPADAISLATINVPPYTSKAKDTVINKNNNRVYTMRDVASLDARVSNIEDYITLSEAEQSAVNYDIIDATTGLSRYKSGYLVDNFSDVDSIADIKDPEFKVSYISGYIKPQFDYVEANLTSVAAGSNVHSTNNMMSLPYTNILLAQQPVSSRITNVNPFAVFSWVGTMEIAPKEDTWTEVENLKDLVTTTTETVTDFVVVTRPLPPVVIPAPVNNFITNVTNVNNNTTNNTFVTEVTNNTNNTFVTEVTNVTNVTEVRPITTQIVIQQIAAQAPEAAPVVAPTPVITPAIMPEPVPMPVAVQAPEPAPAPAPAPPVVVQPTPLPPAPTPIVTPRRGTGCVSVDAWLFDGIQAGDVKVGMMMTTIDPETMIWNTHPVTYSERKVQPVYLLVTASGVELTCSETAPIPTRGGLLVNAPEMVGLETIIQTNNELSWDVVTSVKYLGDREIQHITCGDKCFLAGNKYGSFVLHHNVKMLVDSIFQRNDMFSQF